MRHILSIAYSQEQANFDETIMFQGEEIRLTQFSSSFNFELTKNLIQKYQGQVDVIALSGIPPTIRFKKGIFTHPQVEKLKALSVETPIVDGQLLKNVYIPWAIRQFNLKNQKVLSQKRVSFYASSFQYGLLDVVEEFDNKVFLADPYFFLRLPFCLHKKKALDNFIRFLSPVFKNMEIKKSFLADFKRGNELPKGLDEFFDSEVFVGNETTFKLIDLSHLQGKTVIVDFLGPELEKKFKEVGVSDVIVCMPPVIDNPYVNFSILEGIFQSYKKEGQPLNDDDILNWMDRLELKSEKKEINSLSGEEKSKFAFIIHPLGTKYLFKHPLLRPLKNFSSQLGGVTEELLSFSPGFYYGKIKGIVSEKNGKEVEGLIYTITETPKKLMEKDVGSTYKKLIGLCQKSSDAGASIIGLGAYTKIVGDAGVTVDQNSPIPVTTGNSLSACATLWAAKFALEKIDLVKKNKEGRYQGKVMVVGATGSIGAVSAKILAQRWEEIVLVAPRAYKLLELKEEIQSIDPNAKISISTKPEGSAPDCDLIITTTSARGKKILDIEKVKPGCIICDVSRPFDISEEDALKRPDVLVIASGEVQLPGNIHMGVDLGLEGNIVYACLAETALLAMEGRYESFTLSRNISYEKVLEIDRMANEHGVRLSCIMGHSGFITEEEFELCRSHALENLKGNDHG